MVPLAFFQNLGMPEILIILVIILLLFGHRLPGVGRALGRSVNEFKGGLREGQEAPKDPAATPPASSSEKQEPPKTGAR